MPLSPTPPNVVTSKGDNHPYMYAINSQNKEQITVLECSAAGYVIPPCSVRSKNAEARDGRGEAHGTMYGLSSNG